MPTPGDGIEAPIDVFRASEAERGGRGGRAAEAGNAGPIRSERYFSMRFSIQSLSGGACTRSVSKLGSKQQGTWSSLARTKNSQIHLEELALVPACADFDAGLCHFEQLVEDVGAFLRLDLQPRELNPTRENCRAEFLQPFFDMRAVPGGGEAVSAPELRCHPPLYWKEGRHALKGRDSPSEAQLVRANLVRRPGIARPRNLEQLLDDVASPASASDEFGFEGGEVLSGPSDERLAAGGRAR